MGDDASTRKEPTAAELAEMKQLVAEAMEQGAIGLGASYSLNHSGRGGVPMPSTISDISEFDALVGAMGGPGRGVVEISSGPIMPDRMEPIAARHGRRIFMSTARRALQRAIPRSCSLACSTIAPRHRCAATNLYPDHLPAAVVRLYPGQRLSVLQPSGVRSDQGRGPRAAQGRVPRRELPQRVSCRLAEPKTPNRIPGQLGQDHHRCPDKAGERPACRPLDCRPHSRH